MGQANCTCVKTVHNDELADRVTVKDSKENYLQKCNEYTLLKNIIKIQAILRGWLDRRKFEKIKIKAYNDKVDRILLDFSMNHLTKFSKLPPYSFGEYPEATSNAFFNRYFKNPSLLDNGAIYIGEWCLIFLKPLQFFTVCFIGAKTRSTAKEYKSGRTAQFMRGSGATTRLTARAG